MKTRSLLRYFCGCALILTSLSSVASGFRLPESSISGMSLSNAVVANPEIAGAIIYNPALMSRQESRRLLDFGITNVDLDAEVTPQTGNKASSDGDNPVQLPSYYYMSKLNDQWTWGLGIHAPFGLEIKWPDETFTTFAGPADPLEPEASELKLLNITPNFAYSIDDKHSVAFGINYYKVLDLVFNTQAVEIEADGSDYGFTLAYYFNDGPWSFGATYRSAVETHVDGHINVSIFTGHAEADIELPQMVQLGIRNKVNKQLSVEFDIERTFWSSFDTVEIHHDLPGATGIPTPITNTNNWNDVNAYRLGVVYQLNNLTQLLFGYTYDNTPQPDGSFSARIPDADRQLLSVGFIRELGGEWKINGGAMLVMFDDRTINNSTAFTGGESNGTTAYNGKYESEALLIGIGISKTFQN